MTDPTLQERVELIDMKNAEWLRRLVREVWAERNEFAVELSRLARKNSDLVSGQDTLRAKVAELEAQATNHRIVREASRDRVAELEAERDALHETGMIFSVKILELEARLAVPLPLRIQQMIAWLETSQFTEYREGAQMLESQARRIAELEKDAARYRYLRKAGVWFRTNEELDALIDKEIDAALQASAEEKP